MGNPEGRFPENGVPTRRSFFGLGSAAVAVWNASPLAGADAGALLREAAGRLEYLTPPERVVILDKGKAAVGKLPAAKLREIGLTPETWTLEIVPDPAGGSVVERPLSRANGNALDWNGLMRLAQKHAVRFLHVSTCTNGADPFHMTHWEGVPLREAIWLTGPQANIRRVYYQSQAGENLPPFQSSLPLGQILETPPGLLPVTLAYKMNGQSIPASLGGPVRVVVPGTYGSKSIKWVRRVLLTNDYKANDSDAELNNDVESAMKTRARFINPPKEIAAGQPSAVTGMVQIGVSGLRKVQYCIYSLERPWPENDPNRVSAEWKDAALLPPPTQWGGGLPGGKLPAGTSGFDASGTPLAWPMPYTIAHWAALLGGMPAGRYELCCRTIDGNGIAQPMPRPLLRTGFNAIHRIELLVKA